MSEIAKGIYQEYIDPLINSAHYLEDEYQSELRRNGHLRHPHTGYTSLGVFSRSLFKAPHPELEIRQKRIKRSGGEGPDLLHRPSLVRVAPYEQNMVYDIHIQGENNDQSEEVAAINLKVVKARSSRQYFSHKAFKPSGSLSSERWQDVGPMVEALNVEILPFALGALEYAQDSAQQIRIQSFEEELPTVV